MKWNSRNTPSVGKWNAQNTRFDTCNGMVRVNETGWETGRRPLGGRLAARIVEVEVDALGRVVRAQS